MDEYAEYLAHQRVFIEVDGIVGRYRIGVDGPPVSVEHPYVHDVEEGTVHVIVPGGRLVVRSAEWVGRLDDVGGHVFGWLIAHLDLRQARTRSSARYVDPAWREAVDLANPGRA